MTLASSKPQRQKAEQRLEQAGARQARASDPLKSVWVGASAGTGKTKVLIDRVLRLMLPRPGFAAESATPPGKILCLTFTKTAAAEMSNRIYKVLSGWAVMPDAALDETLAALTGAAPSSAMRDEARKLFARALDTPGGLKIMTLHSFCQSVLKRFPVEAGLPPHFELMDEQSAVEYLTRCQHDIIRSARRAPDGPLATAFNRLTLMLNAEEMSELMSKIISRRNRLAEIFKSKGDTEGRAEKTIAAIYKTLDVAPDDTPEKILAAFSDIDPAHEKDLRQALRVLLEGAATDKKTAEGLQVWLEQKDKRPEVFFDYHGAFTTDKGKRLARLFTQKAADALPKMEELLEYEWQRIEKTFGRLQSLELARINEALLTVVSEMIGLYTRHKRLTDRLDFDDLINRTCDLLSQENMVPWVLFKLDEGVDHILVDEAQDTSPYQWRVVRALADEFLDGQGRTGDRQRTLFVVGDEKQSIYSFQGADPAEFDRMQKYFGGKVTALQESWEIYLEHSFRSTRTVLELVDGVFARPQARAGVVADLSREILHLPFREGQAGLVELWPLFAAEKKKKEKGAEKERDLSWSLPVAVEPGESPQAQLAEEIARTIRGWLDTKEILASRGRPVRAGDILVLVQSRSGAPQIIRALKAKDIDVAGVDRLMLSEEIAVMDLMALARFALLPGDDLSLAELLKSPLVGMGEEELLTLCHGRRSSLWSAVKEKRPEIAAWLSLFSDKAGQTTPYEFFARALYAPCPGDPASGRRALYGRLGFDIEDALGEFLNACLHYEQTHTPALQNFSDWFLRGEMEIKREQEQQKADQVRIMTVHGAKGLQAPIVFLPDTTKKFFDHNKGRVRLLWPKDHKTAEDGGVPLWSPRQQFDAPFYEALRQRAAQEQEEEYRRLLYVALTRAEDRLYIAGYQNRNSPKDDCWYSLIAAAFPASAEEVDVRDMTVRRLSHAQEVPVQEKAEKKKAEPPRLPLPAYALQKPAEEDFPPRPLAPSKPGEDEPAPRSPLDGTTDGRFHRGIIVHKALELLPALPEAQWEKALAAYLARPALGIPPQEQGVFAREILAVLRHPDFAPIFAPGSKAEVPMVGLLKGKEAQIVSGQMDRLRVTDKEILIVDYKTNRAPPKDAKDVAALYLRQMASYRAIMSNIYPGKTVKCALLWTDGPFLMPLPDPLLDPYAP